MGHKEFKIVEKYFVEVWTTEHHDELMYDFEKQLSYLSSEGWELVGPVAVGYRKLVATLSRPMGDAPDAWWDIS